MPHLFVGLVWGSVAVLAFGAVPVMAQYGAHRPGANLLAETQ